MAQMTDLCASIIERATAIERMQSCHLSLDWRMEFAVPQLMACCDRINEQIPDMYAFPENIQRELIQNQAFAPWLSGLLALIPVEDPVAAAPVPTTAYGRYSAPTAQHPTPSPRNTLIHALADLLEQFWNNGLDITVYAQRDIADVLDISGFASIDRLIFLLNFSQMQLSGEARGTVISSLRNCLDVPLSLGEKQRALLLEPFTGTRYLFQSAPFSDIIELLDTDSTLSDILRLLHEKDVSDTLTVEHYKAFAQDAPEYSRLLRIIAEKLDTHATDAFILYWQQSECSLYELRTIVRRIETDHNRDWDTPFVNYSEYVNTLYGQRLKNINMAALTREQEDILIYAIVHNKKHFIKLVDEHPETFICLTGHSILFHPALYKEHFNLNELTEKDMADCATMVQRRLNPAMLASGRRYTFPELRALYGVSEQQLRLYHALTSDSQDYRLRVFRQLINRDVLPVDMSVTDISALAGRLDIKPLYDWIRDDFGHVDGLTAQDGIQMLIHLDELRSMLPSLRTRIDALLALRNLNTLPQYATIDALKDDLLRIDTDWHCLSERMGLGEAFREKHRESIIAFLCENGAAIAMTYLRGIDEKQQEAFLRVVKAELMGQLCELKYFGDDLQVELDASLTSLTKIQWPTNLHIANDNMEVREHDDFFSTMLLGTQPQRTCLSYCDGAYKSCLLSAFDSNKKVLYVYLNGRIVGRAFLRLTKGRMYGADTSDSANNDDFTFVDLENASAPRSVRSKKTDHVTLFLERPYISGVGPEQAAQVRRMLVSLAEHKADDMETMLVLSQDYRDNSLKNFMATRYSIYISRSKAGAQYLDSLGGEATVSAVGSYRESNFLVREQKRLFNAS